MQRLPYALLIYLMHWRRRPGEKKIFFTKLATPNRSDTVFSKYSYQILWESLHQLSNNREVVGCIGAVVIV